MSQKRQNAVFDPLGDNSSQIKTLTHDYAAGHVIPAHFHDRDQLVYASRGVMTVRTRDGTWVVPTHRAVWIPAAVPHTITMSGTVAMRTLYLRPRLAKTLPRGCCVVNVPPLLRELILNACKLASLTKTVQWHAHLIDVIIDQLKVIETVPLQLPNPSDPRALRVAAVLIADPSDRRPLTQICKAAGASRRTVERLFQEDMGITFGKWRQQLRLMQAMRLLAEGAKVTHAALESGYSTPSAFISMFRKALGTTPTLYFKTHG
jgi:AraC-like DNA-binding protein/mannose-6-phosphate isomerase-like protein (cupin superfamily)